MRISVFTKLTACYIFILVTPFILFQTMGARIIRKEIMDDLKSSLYKDAHFISKEITYTYYHQNLPINKLKYHLETLGNLTNASILMTDVEGSVILSVQGGNVEDASIHLKETHLNVLQNTFSENITIPRLVKEPSLIVTLPVTGDQEIYGYLLLVSPMHSVEEQFGPYLMHMQYLFIPYSIISLIVFVLIYFFMVHPLNKVIKAAKNYVSGNYGYELRLSSNDEFLTLSDTLSYMAGELNSLDDYRKNFIANISHDFRSPLTSIKGYVDAMKDGTIPIERQDKYLNVILFETERLTKLTKDLLELNNYENKRVWLEKKTFDINATIRKTVESFEGVCLKKRICLFLNFNEDVTIVDADMGKIQQVLYNLLDNAIKFSHNDSQIKISTSTKGEKAFISIKDYGIGIPKESLNHIWERFYKLDSSRGKDKKGTGLGLSIAREIIRAHGENINVISTVDVGSEFIFSLPLG